jgi:hypothetical protein
VAHLTVTNVAPGISAQPQNQSVVVAGDVTFSVSATGTAPLGFRWFFNTNTLIDDATTNTFTVTNAQQTNAGGYSVIITNSVGSVTSRVALLTVISTAPNIIAQWNFNSTTPDNSTGTGSTVPSTGNGTAALVGGLTPTFATGDTNYDAAASNDNSAWNTTGYPAATSNNKTAGAQFNVSTIGKKNITVSWSQRSSNTGGKYFRLQYSTNGSTFTDFPTSVTTSTNFIAFTNSLASLPGVENNPNFAIRIVAEFESTAINTANASYVAAFPNSTYASSGTTRYDMVTVSGAAITATAAPVLTSASIKSGNQFQFMVTGTTGSNYVIQVSTNLSASNWVSIFTNAAPFTFTDSNAANFPQGFYRAVALP